MATPPIFARSYKLPHGFTCEFRLDLDQISPGEVLMQAFACEWSPDVPKFSSQRALRRFLSAYTVARNDFLQDVAQLIGGKVAVVDTDERLRPIDSTLLEPQAAQ